MKTLDTPDIIVPIAIELDDPTPESTIADILEQNRNYGISRFALACPGGGWRSVGAPPAKRFEELAQFFKTVRDKLVPYGIECGWWDTLTVKSGPVEGGIRPIKIDGEEHGFASCPIDPVFIKKIAENMSLFAKIAKPAFIITEDDFSISAFAGCFCKYHLDGFAKRMGKYYSREELVEIFKLKNPEDINLTKQWREFIKEGLVNLAKAIRAEVDKENPEIPIGYMQAGSCDRDGDVTFDICRAFAGDRHTPFSRLCGAMYGGFDAKAVPHQLYHALYGRQHIEGDFIFYHESDTFPHTRFFTAGAHMRSMMSAVYSYGFDGSTFQTQQLLDYANEEPAYGKMFAKQRARFRTACNISKQCEIKGVQIDYDPFFNTLDRNKESVPFWVKPISRFGIPHTTTESNVCFWDIHIARFADDETVLKKLSKTLFLDGAAAKALCERGFEKYIGVKVSESVTKNSRLVFDLGARETIKDGVAPNSKGRNMPSAHMLAPHGNGELLKLEVTNPDCRVLTEAYTFQKNLICPAMTVFENDLGGKVVVMGETIENNMSQSLYNYRRKKIFLELLHKYNDEFVTVTDAPDVYLIENEAKDESKSGFKGMLTLINLCEDELDFVQLHLPPKWKTAEFKIMDKNGEWQNLDVTKTEDGIVIEKQLGYLMPMFVLVK